MAGLYASLTPTVPAIIPPDMKKFYAGMARDYSKALILGLLASDGGFRQYNSTYFELSRNKKLRDKV